MVKNGQRSRYRTQYKNRDDNKDKHISQWKRGNCQTRLLCVRSSSAIEKFPEDVVERSSRPLDRVRRSVDVDGENFGVVPHHFRRLGRQGAVGKAQRPQAFQDDADVADEIDQALLRLGRLR